MTKKILETCDQRPIFGLEILYKINETFPEILKKYWGEKVVSNPIIWFEAACSKAKEAGAQLVSVAFNIDDVSEINDCKNVLTEIAQIAQKTETILLLKGCGQKDLDEALLPELIPLLTTQAIIAPVQDNNYKAIIKAALSAKPKGDCGEHCLVLRTPIDINLTKELNILSIDEGLSAQNILIDPDMGCVGYGLDYGYSIIERIVCARSGNGGDKMLDMPIIVFCGTESYKAKEAKSEDFSPSWGDIKTRSLSWEIATTTALICAGADIAVVWHPQSIVVLNETFKGRQ